LDIAARKEPIRGYVISLARRPDRRERFLRWNTGKGVDLHVFDAVDGRALRKPDLVEQGIVDRESLGFSAGALGNALSHRRLWQTCIELDRPLMVFEDDAFVPPEMPEWTDRLAAEAEHGCDIFFAGYNRDARLSIGFSGQWCNLTFVAPLVAFEVLAGAQKQSRCIVDARQVWGTLAYAIAPRGAQTLLRHCFPLSDKTPLHIYGSQRVLAPHTLDAVINVVLQRGLARARTVFPPLVISPNDASDSDVL
jgi:glycosyl transferase family 25